MGIIVLVAGYLFFHLVHYVAHRWLVHRPIVAALHRAHMRGHHGAYRGNEYESDEYTEFANGFGTDALVAVPIVALGYVVLPWWVFVIFATEVAALSAAHYWVHRSFHVRGHWLKRLPLFSRLDRLHEEHHRNVESNFGIGFHGFDRVFSTYAEGKRARGPRPMNRQ